MEAECTKRKQSQCNGMVYYSTGSIEKKSFEKL